MSFFERLFGSRRSQLPNINFGRYTDAYKTEEQQAAWNRSLELFDQDKHLEAYREFFTYLRDEKADNVQWEADGDTLHFKFWQGSQRVTGVVTADKVTAESKIARADDLNVGFLRRLMEYNYTLKLSPLRPRPGKCPVHPLRHLHSTAPRSSYCMPCANWPFMRINRTISCWTNSGP